MPKRVDPLDWRTPIVDGSGRPTQEFMRKWQEQKGINSGVPTDAASLSVILDFIGSTQGDLLVRGTTKWARLASPADATKFLNGAAAPAYASVKDSDLSTSDITANDVSNTKHGFQPKSPADATKFLNGAAAPAYAAVKDSDLSTSDITTNDVSTAKHGFAPKLPNDATKFLDGTGAYSTPAGGGGGGGASWHPGIRGTGWFYPVTFNGTSTTSVTYAQDRIFCSPIFLTACTLTQIAVNCSSSSASSTARLGLYSNAGGAPDALVLDCGTVSTATTGLKTITSLAMVVTTGWYWVVATLSTGGTGLTTIGSSTITPASAYIFGVGTPNAVAAFSASGLAMNRTYATLPASLAGSSWSYITGMPLIGLAL